MNTLSLAFNIITISCYLAAAALELGRFNGKLLISKIWPLTICAVAAMIHCYLLYLLIETRGGQNLSSLNMASLVAWLIVSLVTLAAIRKPVTSLLIIILPIAAVAVIAANFSGSFIIETANDTVSLAHILLAIVTFSVLGFSACQALILAWQHHSLRHGTTRLKILPPIEAMESLLFQTIAIGFALLSFALASGFFSISSNLTLSFIWEKSAIAISAWLVFAALICGRLLWGWRGMRATYWTLSGLIFVAVAFFGSKLLVLIN